MIELIIDTRERDLIDKVSQHVSVKVEQLDVGDIIFRQDGEDVLVIERKTVSDLKASICDGRAREQKVRLLGTLPRSRIMYLIEGSLDKPLDSKAGGLPVSTLVGSLINTQLRDGIKVYKTSSIGESVDFIRRLLEKLEKDGDKYFKDENLYKSASEYSSTLKKSKKANMTPQVWFISQLSLIPQVTEKIAAAIAEKYPTAIELVREYERLPESFREKLLSDIVYPIKNDKTRRVGVATSSRIACFFYASE